MASCAKLTDYGFEWGPMHVTRCAATDRHMILQVKTEHDAVDIYVTKRGRKIRIFDKDGEWLRIITK